MNASERMNEMIRLGERVGFEPGFDLMVSLSDMGFFDAPASTKYHGANEGGLFDHSISVAKHLIDLTEKNALIWQREQSPFIVGMFHDLCKCDQYALTEGKYRFRDDMLLNGHGDKSCILLGTLMRITEEEAMCIRYHMGAFTEKEEWGKYTGAIHRYGNVLWTHHADMPAAHRDGV